MGDIFSEVVLLLQEETALRLVESSLRTSEYRPINVFVNFYSEPEYNFRVPRTNFFPQPNVDAAVVTFRLKQAPDYPSVASTKSFFSMVHSAFNGKRKMLRRSLQHICPSNEIERALGDAGLPTTSRPEELTLDDFVKLYNMIAKTYRQGKALCSATPKFQLWVNPMRLIDKVQSSKLIPGLMSLKFSWPRLHFHHQLAFLLAACLPSLWQWQRREFSAATSGKGGCRGAGK
ncbi:hypothetical protein Golob_027432 [Gossypium lobatum]|uniref:rRNA adenine N(6)-methyltransferase n=1 Tax=Gossypium lobatum TaxID=34289 RepID=A0A7J8NE53_9ROSI|nr:hypothetical protein [Gossypium lobatum]